MPDAKILLVEDDLNLGTILKEFLEIKGFSIVHAMAGESAGRIYEEEYFDLCILDIMLPKKDGLTLAKEIRSVNAGIPLIFLTAKSMQGDKIKGLKLGADDYITKPFSSEELLLRITNILKRVSGSKRNAGSPEDYELGNYKFHYARRTLALAGHTEKLTTREADLLKLLAENKNEIVPRTNALKKIWNEDNYFTARSMDVYIVKLRRYLRHDKSVQIINVHGTGFKLVTY